MPSNAATSSSAVGPHAENPALLTKTSMSPTCSASRRISAGLPRSAARKRSAPGVASVHDHLETVGGQLHGDRAADPGRRSGHECSQGKDVGHVFAPTVGGGPLVY